jgi:hypothetical protein
MRCALYAFIALFTVSGMLNAAVIRFDSDPFAGSTALTTPGRQVVGNEPSIAFSIPADVFSLDPAVFNVVSAVLFANDVAANLPTTGVNVVVLQTLDNDANPATLFGAGNAADLIAAQITSPGPGFFIYFNQNLNLPRLVYSTDLSINTADLKILARMPNLTGQTAALPTFTASNFEITAVPEPSTGVLMTAAAALWACGYGLRRRRYRG